MVFLTSVDILDTGFLTKAKTGSQVATGDRANLGKALKLKGVRIQFDSSANLDDEPNIGTNGDDTQEVPLISIEPISFSITLNLDSELQSTDNHYDVNDVLLIKELLWLPRTVGLKALYYPVKWNSQQRNNNGQLLSWIGEKDTTEPQGDIDIDLWGSSQETGLTLTDVKYIPCRFKSCTISQEPTSTIMKVKLNGVISK